MGEGRKERKCRSLTDYKFTPSEQRWVESKLREENE